MEPADDLVDRVRAAIAHVEEVTERRMFGALGFMVRGKLCLSARPERLMCRIDPAIHAAAVAREGCQTVVMKGQERRGYVYVDSRSVATADALHYWVNLALAHNAGLDEVEPSA